MQGFREWHQRSSAEYDAAINAHDTAKALSFFAENAIRVTPLGIQSGRAEIEKGLAMLFMNAKPRRHESTVAHVHVSGDEAWAAGSYSVTVSAPGNEALHIKGFWATVFARDGDAWKIQLESFNRTPAGS
jgi:uncharacterized protein (TIGR02246 family)